METLKECSNPLRNKGSKHINYSPSKTHKI